MKDHDSDNIVNIDSAHDEKVVAIDFYRLTDTIDVNQKVINDNYRLIDWFCHIRFYRLH